jgi:hypothetical protein
MTMAMAGLAGCILWKLVDHLTQITDPVALGVWLGAVPVVLASLTGLFAAPYGLNKASGSVSDIVKSLAEMVRKKNE